MIEIKTLAKGFIGYKAAGYADWDPQKILSNPDADSGTWSGLYVAKDIETAKGYLQDALPESGTGTSYLYGVHLLEDQKMISCEDRIIGDGAIDGSFKADFVRTHLHHAGIDIAGKLLMPALGSLGFFLECYHNDESKEIIVPNKLCRSVVLMKMATYKYQGWDKKSKVKNTQLIEYQGER